MTKCFELDTGTAVLGKLWFPGGNFLLIPEASRDGSCVCKMLLDHVLPLLILNSPRLVC